MSQTVPSETLPENSESHPRAFAPATLLLLVLSIFGAVIGVQLLTTLGVTPNTAIIGAMAAMIIARIPLQCFARFRSIHIQNPGAKRDFRRHIWRSELVASAHLYSPAVWP